MSVWYSQNFDVVLLLKPFYLYGNFQYGFINCETDCVLSKYDAANFMLTYLGEFE